MGKSTWIALLLMPLCVGVATAQPITTRPSAKVIDPAHVFSAEAVDRAARLIDQISERHHKDVLVLAYLTIPMDKAADFQAKSRDQFFADWSAQLAREHQLNGMLVVVIKQMGRLEITVGNQTLQHQFTTADRDKLREYNELYLRLGNYPYDQDPGRPKWTPLVPNDRWADPVDDRPVHIPH